MSEPSPCPFCTLADDVPRIAESASCFAILSRQPIHPFHVLVIPRVHVEAFPAVPPEVASAVFLMAQGISAAVAKLEGVDGVTHLSDDELGERQINLVRHYKLHVIPRTAGELHRLEWHRAEDPTPEVLGQRVASLRGLVV
ncbi:MAG: HIT domain-containing protein [Myxococcales bacterium]|nr:HIT domain-containing protein [Myxococcales bacterium]